MNSSALRFDDSRSSDFVFVAEGKEIFVHRAVIADRSPFLRDFLLKDPSCTRINANNALFESMKAVLKALYNDPGANVMGSLQYNFDITLSAFEISLHFTLSSLSTRIADQLVELLSNQNVSKTLKACAKHPNNEIVKKVASECQRHLPPVLDTPEAIGEWKMLCAKHPTLIPAAAPPVAPRRSPSAVSETSRSAPERDDAGSSRHHDMSGFSEPTAQTSTRSPRRHSTIHDQHRSLQQEFSQVQSRFSDFRSTYSNVMENNFDVDSSRQAPPQRDTARVGQLQEKLASIKSEYQRRLLRYQDEKEQLERSLKDNEGDTDVELKEERYELSRAMDRLNAVKSSEEKARAAAETLNKDLEENATYLTDSEHYVSAIDAATTELEKAVTQTRSSCSNSASVRRSLRDFGLNLRDEKNSVSEKLAQQQYGAETLQRRLDDEEDRLRNLEATFSSLAAQ